MSKSNTQADAKPAVMGNGQEDLLQQSRVSRLETIAFTVDGREAAATPDETIWQVARRLGIDIPHLCYLPQPGYRPDGNCRACMVEVQGERVLAASCIRKPTPGLQVATASERVKAARAIVFELLVSDQPQRTTKAHD